MCDHHHFHFIISMWFLSFLCDLLMDFFFFFFFMLEIWNSQKEVLCMKYNAKQIGNHYKNHNWNSITSPKSQLLQVSLRRNAVGSGMILLSMWVLHSSQVAEVAWQKPDTTFLVCFLQLLSETPRNWCDWRSVWWIASASSWPQRLWMISTALP